MEKERTPPVTFHSFGHLTPQVFEVFGKKILEHFSPIKICVFINSFKLGCRPGVVLSFDLMWFVCMTLVPPSTNKVFTCAFPPALTRWMGHVTAPIIICNALQGSPSLTRLHMCSLDSIQCCSGSSGSSFSWLLITACCGICFRRIMLPILTTVLSSPGNLYNCTEC